MQSTDDVLRARHLIDEAREFMRDLSTLPAVMPTYDFYTGALFAIDWMLKQKGHRDFGEHLDFLQKMRREMVLGAGE